MFFSKLILVLIFSRTVSAWTPNSWKNKPSKQLPKYRNTQKLEQVETILANKPPLVISPEIDNLKSELQEIEQGRRFLFMGGDCAETFREHSSQNIINNYQLFILSTIILMTQTLIRIKKNIWTNLTFINKRIFKYFHNHDLFV